MNIYKNSYKITIDTLPDELKKIRPGKVVLCFPSRSSRAKGTKYDDIVTGFANYSYNSRFSFKTDVDILYTTDKRLHGLVVARRLDVNCIDRYTLLIGHNNNPELFYSEYFNLTRVDDRYIVELKKIDPTPSIHNIESIIPLCITDKLDCCIESGILYSEESSLPTSVGGLPSSQYIKFDPEEDEASFQEDARQEFIDQISALILDYVAKHKTMPPMDKVNEVVRGKLNLSNYGLSRIVVNENLNVVLPEYNEIILPFHPLQLTLYVFFLRHPQGIYLRDISSYHRELVETYNVIMPNRQDFRALRSIDAICNLEDSSLREKLSQIKRIVKSKIINETLAANYYITGERGSVYKLSIPENMIQLPACLH